MPRSSSPAHSKSPATRLVRWLVFRLVRLFYSNIEVRGRTHVPRTGPTLFVLNHPNGLLDPLLLMIGLDRPVLFLAKSTFFGNPIGRWLMDAFGALPVYRKRDEGKWGGPQGDAPQRNEETFARCRSLLHRGAAMALFPEGTTHSGAQLLPLRTGAARIALSAEAEAEGSLEMRIVPVGLWYEDKTRFRTSVLLVVGEPFTLDGHVEAYASDERSAVKAVTDRIDTGLDVVVLQAENADLLTAIPAVAAWTVPDGTVPDRARHHAWAATLLSAYQKLHHTDPARLEDIARKARRYAALLQTLGIADPWSLEVPVARRGKLVRHLLMLGMTALPALAGALLSYGPYRLAGPVATYAVRGDDTQTGTFKLIGGSLFVLIGWMAEAAVCGYLLGWPWGVLLIVAAPLLGY
ncbi:MAG: lysophospholipid acyltransferase family protein, partial [Rhodothermales bacterium]